MYYIFDVVFYLRLLFISEGIGKFVIIVASPESPWDMIPTLAKAKE